MIRTVYWVDRNKKMMEIKHYGEGELSTKLLGYLLVPVASITSAEMNTLIVTRLSGQVMFLEVLTGWIEGIDVCKEWDDEETNS